MRRELEDLGVMFNSIRAMDRFLNQPNIDADFERQSMPGLTRQRLSKVMADMQLLADEMDRLYGEGSHS